ncbi:hypothetical protein [Kitasatospora phosalacinea]|uniref:Knr4/Smi1-like domain-containing protein n=1 Tax=Kitasatospora phosalacinea TaxID=2065 RepID=A0A9W6PJM3_9ACTN|nr:hypothetical protein [Kitasatospora phosalacinea]GLW56042.1 hypothetical protein Kpho01_40530 [Kitasatospora phosalacinea]
MDDLIGTQSPARRLTDPDEALAAFEGSSPEFAALRRPEPAALDWATVAEGLETELPPDFVLLTERYSRLILGRTLLVSTPLAGHERAWVEGVLEDQQIVEEWCEEARLDPPLRAFPAPGGLLRWGTTDWGDFLLWSTHGSPADWTVTVATRGGGWWHYEGGVVQFLMGLVDGSIEQWGLHRISPEITG